MNPPFGVPHSVADFFGCPQILTFGAVDNKEETAIAVVVRLTLNATMRNAIEQVV
jgi:hypothetical protein